MKIDPENRLALSNSEYYSIRMHEKVIPKKSVESKTKQEQISINATKKYEAVCGHKVRNRN